MNWSRDLKSLKTKICNWFKFSILKESEDLFSGFEYNNLNWYYKGKCVGPNLELTTDSYRKTLREPTAFMKRLQEINEEIKREEELKIFK